MSTANQYLLRAPFSLQKITWIPDTKTVIYRSRRSWHTKRNFEVFKATELTLRCASFLPRGRQSPFGRLLAAAIEHIPPKGQQRPAAMIGIYHWRSHTLHRRSQTIRYYGLYSNKSRGIARPTAALVAPPPEKAAEKPEPEIILVSAPPKTTARAMRPLWRDLILSVWGTDPLKCLCCPGTMRRVETIVSPEDVEKRRRIGGVLDRNPRSG